MGGALEVVGRVLGPRRVCYGIWYGHGWMAWAGRAGGMRVSGGRKTRRVGSGDISVQIGRIIFST
jgi:hypothetical protein